MKVTVEESRSRVEMEEDMLNVDWWVVLVLVEECVDGRTDHLQLEMNRSVESRLESRVLTRLGQVNTLFTSYHYSALGQTYLLAATTTIPATSSPPISAVTHNSQPVSSTM